MKKMKNITLEVSLKPFDKAYGEIENVCRQIYAQWDSLLRCTETVSIMLWTADGSEILEYKGELDEEFEWCCHIFTANPPLDKTLADWGDFAGYPYRGKPGKMTYGKLKYIIETLKRVGKERFPHKKIRIVETFDIGPEFAVSDFKYRRHREILGGAGEGIRTMFVSSTSALHADRVPYAAFPEGIPEGLPFATFLGKQASVFFRDMGFEALWLSNGMGFSAEPWQTEGDVFRDGSFHAEKLGETREAVMRFWQLLREAMPNIRVETRGTNMSLGIDYSTDGVPLYELYRGDLDFLPPCNSPWAALDGNYGLELMGHMSRNAVVPQDDDWLFRFYVHDPWFKNSPWYDRYEGKPMDIYPPMAISRIDERGSTTAANHMNLLSIDNSLGTMPLLCAAEPVAHLVRAIKEIPDAPPPFVWLYPAKEYCAVTDNQGLREMFGGDWLICDAINHTFPLSGVISTDSFLKIDLDILHDSVLLSSIPYAGSDWERGLMDYMDRGGKVMLVGALTGASEDLKARLGVRTNDSTCREVTLPAHALLDECVYGKYARRLVQDSVGGVLCFNTENADRQHENVIFSEEGVLLAKGKDNVYWMCGVQTAEYRAGKAHLVSYEENIRASGGAFLRHGAKYFGWDISLGVRTPESKTPATLAPRMMIHRHDGGFYYSTVNRNTTVDLKLSTPYGAPLFMGYETVLEGGRTSYRLPRAERLECRVFLEKNEEETVVSAREFLPSHMKKKPARRRIEIKWLKNATLRFFPERYAMDSVYAIEFENEGRGRERDSRRGELAWRREGDHYVAEGITGRLMICLPDYEGYPDCYAELAKRDAEEYRIE